MQTNGSERPSGRSKAQKEAPERHKKLWVYVKRGFIIDSKHRAAIGVCIWLYLYILDRANWERGVIDEWTDEIASEDMNMPQRTLRDQRLKLAEAGYITCHKKQRGQRIIIHKWICPRSYGGEVLNKQGGKNLPPSEPQSGKKVSPWGVPSDIPFDTPSDTPSYRKHVTPTSNSLVSCQESISTQSHINALGHNESISPTEDGAYALNQTPAHASKTANPEPKVLTPLQAFIETYYSHLGYACTNWGKEGSAVKWLMANGYSVEQAIACWDYLETDAWWTDKPVDLAVIRQQVGNWVRLGCPAYKANGKGNGHATDEPRGMSGYRAIMGMKDGIT